ncbi:hypothetical protein D9757_008025 [Collybiopsis confluens]|uniref:Uncharacterized protein n=1 Tax=Collybiopsis confluens TaxID=2823264 RepID=A0A8H5H6L3_9AGAR|nr:hypothetical protein D9757_008025 [Collybiopsis confluens]
MSEEVAGEVLPVNGQLQNEDTFANEESENTALLEEDPSSHEENSLELNGVTDAEHQQDASDILVEEVLEIDDQGLNTEEGDGGASTEYSYENGASDTLTEEDTAVQEPESSPGEAEIPPLDETAAYLSQSEPDVLVDTTSHEDLVEAPDSSLLGTDDSTSPEPAEAQEVPTEVIAESVTEETEVDDTLNDVSIYQYPNAEATEELISEADNTGLVSSEDVVEAPLVDTSSDHGEGSDLVKGDLRPQDETLSESRTTEPSIVAEAAESLYGQQAISESSLALADAGADRFGQAAGDTGVLDASSAEELGAQPTIAITELPVTEFEEVAHLEAAAEDLLPSRVEEQAQAEAVVDHGDIESAAAITEAPTSELELIAGSAAVAEGTAPSAAEGSISEEQASITQADVATEHNGMDSTTMASEVPIESEEPLSSSEAIAEGTPPLGAEEQVSILHDGAANEPPATGSEDIVHDSEAVVGEISPLAEEQTIFEGQGSIAQDDIATETNEVESPNNASGSNEVVTETDETTKVESEADEIAEPVGVEAYGALVQSFEGEGDANASAVVKEIPSQDDILVHEDGMNAGPALETAADMQAKDEGDHEELGAASPRMDIGIPSSNVECGSDPVAAESVTEAASYVADLATEGAEELPAGDHPAINASIGDATETSELQELDVSIGESTLDSVPTEAGLEQISASGDTHGEEAADEIIESIPEVPPASTDPVDSTVSPELPDGVNDESPNPDYLKFPAVVPTESIEDAIPEQDLESVLETAEEHPEQVLNEEKTLAESPALNEVQADIPELALDTHEDNGLATRSTPALTVTANEVAEMGFNSEQPVQLEQPPRPSSPWVPSYSVSVQGSPSVSTHNSPRLVVTEPAQAEETPEQIILPEATVGSEVTDDNKEAGVTEVTDYPEPVDIQNEPQPESSAVDDAEQFDTVGYEGQYSAGNALTLDVEDREVERPKSPWTPSYSVTNQGPDMDAGKDSSDIEQAVAPAPALSLPESEAQPAEVQNQISALPEIAMESEAKEIETAELSSHPVPEDAVNETEPDHSVVELIEEVGTVAVADSVSALTVDVDHAGEMERPKSPWTPSYSVTSQGPDIDAGKDHSETEQVLSEDVSLPKSEVEGSAGEIEEVEAASLKPAEEPAEETTASDIPTVQSAEYVGMEDEDVPNKILQESDAPSTDEAGVLTPDDEGLVRDVTYEDDSREEGSTQLDHSEVPDKLLPDSVTDTDTGSDPSSEHVEPVYLVSNVGEPQHGSENETPETSPKSTVDAGGPQPAGEGYSELNVEAAGIERPKSPWTPSYAITNHGGDTNVEDTREIEQHSSSSDLVNEESQSNPGRLEDKSEQSLRPSSPWVPSYSVSRQGSPSVSAHTSPVLAATQPPSDEQIHELSLQPEATAASSSEEMISKEEGKEKEVPFEPIVELSSQTEHFADSKADALFEESLHSSRNVLPSDLPEDRGDALNEAGLVDQSFKEQHEKKKEEDVPQANVFDELPEVTTSESQSPPPSKADDLPTAAAATEIKRTRSPWGSYEVQENGEEKVPVHSSSVDEEHAVEHHPDKVIPEVKVNTEEPQSDDKLKLTLDTNGTDIPDRPKSPWTPSYSVTRQGSRSFEDVKENNGLAKSDQVPSITTQEDAAPKGETFPAAQQAEEQQDTVGDTLTVAKDRKRLESTASSLFFPGGWFSKPPAGGRESLDNAQGEITSPKAMSPVEGPSTAFSTAPSVEVEVNSDGEDQAKKGKWCVIM